MAAIDADGGHGRAAAGGVSCRRPAAPLRCRARSAPPFLVSADDAMGFAFVLDVVAACRLLRRPQVRCARGSPLSLPPTAWFWCWSKTTCSRCAWPCGSSPWSPTWSELPLMRVFNSSHFLSSWPRISLRTAGSLLGRQASALAPFALTASVRRMRIEALKNICMITVWIFKRSTL